MTSFRLDRGRVARQVKASDPVPPSRRPPAPATGAVGTLTCGHKYYEPFIQSGKYIWCEECQHNREKKSVPRAKPAEQASDTLFPF